MQDDHKFAISIKDKQLETLSKKKDKLTSQLVQLEKKYESLMIRYQNLMVERARGFEGMSTSSMGGGPNVDTPQHAYTAQIKNLLPNEKI